MKKNRLIGFIIVLVIGIAAGLVFGWVKPFDVANTSLDSLRADYKADYVLMVAEVYAADGNVQQAADSLKHLEPLEPLDAVKQALGTATQMGYSLSDLRFMADLEKALTENTPGGTSK